MERERAIGLEVHLLTPQQVRGRLPVLSGNIELWGGSFCPSDGTANPLILGRALAHALLRAGVEVYGHEEILNLDTAAGSLSGVRGSRHHFRCPAQFWQPNS